MSADFGKVWKYYKPLVTHEEQETQEQSDLPKAT